MGQFWDSWYSYQFRYCSVNNSGLLLSAKEDIFITKNGKIVAKLTNPHQDRVEVAKSLFGILPKDADLNEAKEERLGAK